MEQLSALSTWARRNVLNIVLLLLAASVVLSAYTLSKYQGIETQARRAAVQRAVYRIELGNCHRLDILRARVNRSAQAIWSTDETQAAIVLASLRQQIGTIHRTPAQIDEAKRFVNAYYSAANSERWIPLTNCHRAVYDPGYKPPEPHKMPAPKSSFVVQPGQ